MSQKVRGQCLIINNEHFDVDEVEERVGSAIDAANLESLFGQLGFKVCIQACIHATFKEP